MTQQWFEMPEIRRRKLASSVWIPLRASEVIIQEGRFGYAGYRKEFLGVGTVAVPLSQRTQGAGLDWHSLGLMSSHSGCVEADEYVPCDVLRDVGLLGVRLVIEQRGNSAEHKQ